MSHVQKKKRQVKFQDQVQVLPFKKKQAVSKLLGCRKENIPLYEGESEYTKKRRNMKKGANRSPPREGVRMVLERQRDIEAQFWAVYCRQVWAKIRRLSQQACYGCSHRKTDEKHHNTRQMSDEDCIRRFMEMALDDVRCLEVIREWYDGLSCLNPPLSENEMLLFDTPWVLQHMGRRDRTAILLELMVENNMELLEAVEALERQQQQQPKCSDDEIFEFCDEFLDLVKRMEERGDTKEEEEPVVIQPDDVNPELLGQEQEQEAMTVEPIEVSFFQFFFKKIKEFISYVPFFWFPSRTVLSQ